MDQLKLLSMTALVTLLIWVAADSLVNETAKVNVTVMVSPEPGYPDMIVERPAEPRLHEVDVTGPRRVMSQLQLMDDLVVRLRVPHQPAGPTTVPLREALNDQWHEYRRLRVTAVTPPTLELTVDHLVTVDAALIIKPPQVTVFEVPPHLDRSTVSLKLRKSVHDQMVQEGRVPQIELDADALFQGQLAGTSVRMPVTLDASPFGANATVTPKTVLVTATVSTRRVTAELTSVPVLLAVSFANFGRPVAAVTQDGEQLPVFQNISVTGDPETIERLRAGETRVIGLIQLRESDFSQANEWRVVKPEFQLPPGVVLAAEPKPVEFKLVPVEPPAKVEAQP